MRQTEDEYQMLEDGRAGRGGGACASQDQLMADVGWVCERHYDARASRVLVHWHDSDISAPGPAARPGPGGGERLGAEPSLGAGSG
jgi:hypothetical protein